MSQQLPTSARNLAARALLGLNSPSEPLATTTCNHTPSRRILSPTDILAATGVYDSTPTQISKSAGSVSSSIVSRVNTAVNAAPTTDSRMKQWLVDHYVKIDAQSSGEKMFALVR